MEEDCYKNQKRKIIYLLFRKYISERYKMKSMYPVASWCKQNKKQTYLHNSFVAFLFKKTKHFNRTKTNTFRPPVLGCFVLGHFVSPHIYIRKYVKSKDGRFFFKKQQLNTNQYLIALRV